MRKPVERGLPRRRLRDELGDHRIVVGRDLPTGFDAGVDADIARQFQRHDRAGRRQEAVLGVLGIDARLDGVAVEADLPLRVRQLFAGGNAQLPFDQIEAGDRLCHRVLDLETGIHFDEPEGVRPQSSRAVGDKFDGAGAAIIHRLGRLDCCCADPRAQVRGHARRRRFLDHLLMPALQRAVALAEMNGIAMPVGKHLDFDMARRGHIFFDQDPARAECGLGFRGLHLRARSRNRRACRPGACRGRRHPPPA